MNDIKMIIELYTEKKYNKETNKIIDFFSKIFIPIGVTEIKQNDSEKIADNFDLTN